MDCSGKVRHNSLLDARVEADRYHYEISMTFDPMVSYFCKLHACWHNGHDKWFPERLRISYATRSALRHQLRADAAVRSQQLASDTRCVKYIIRRVYLRYTANNER
jgi:hypothetical protein